MIVRAGLEEVESNYIELFTDREETEKKLVINTKKFSLTNLGQSKQRTSPEVSL
jgi:hypothetical protein